MRIVSVDNFNIVSELNLTVFLNLSRLDKITTVTKNITKPPKPISTSGLSIPHLIVAIPAKKNEIVSPRRKSIISKPKTVRYLSFVFWAIRKAIKSPPLKKGRSIEAIEVINPLDHRKKTDMFLPVVLINIFCL